MHKTIEKISNGPQRDFPSELMAEAALLALLFGWQRPQWSVMDAVRQAWRRARYKETATPPRSFFDLARAFPCPNFPPYDEWWLSSHDENRFIRGTAYWIRNQQPVPASGFLSALRAVNHLRGSVELKPFRRRIERLL